MMGSLDGAFQFKTGSELTTQVKAAILDHGPVLDESVLFREVESPWKLPHGSFQTRNIIFAIVISLTESVRQAVAL